MAIELDQPVATFQAQATGGLQVDLAALKGEQVVLYFYPKDNTPGCTTEGQDFRDRYEAFRAVNTRVFGVSRDSLKTHENFKNQAGLPLRADQRSGRATLPTVRSDQAEEALRQGISGH